jgi:phosphotransferase system enzyme I (PtsI)
MDAAHGSTELRGIGVSPGVVIGPVLRAAPPLELPLRRTAGPDPGTEIALARKALLDVAADLTARAAAVSGKTSAEVLRSQAAMISDPVLEATVVAGIRSGTDAVHAICDAFGVHRDAFAAAGGYLAERLPDLDDLRDRAVANCLGRPMPGVPSPGYPFVLLAGDLAPADTADLDAEQVLALVTEAGGPTSHTAILARSLGIPAVVRCEGILDLRDGETVAVDGTAGTVRSGIEEEEASFLRQREGVRRSARARNSRGPGQTADGYPVGLHVNIGSARDLDSLDLGSFDLASLDLASFDLGSAGPGNLALDSLDPGSADPGVSVEGVGLFRTELLYLDRSEYPDHAEQVAAYTEVFAALPGRKVTVRTLDAGADKPLPFLPARDEPNPALGIRGLRLSRRDPALLDSQLTAIAEAASVSEAEVWVMAPMVATVAEATEFRDRCRAVGLPRAGVMVEIPAAALAVESLVKVVDFLSIGTNDLSQYLFAADRQCGDLADLLDPWHPILLRLIASCASAARTADRPIGVCGEAAADPALALILTGLGVTTLSMSARAVPEVRQALAAHTLGQCRQLAQAALATEDAMAARQTAQKLLRDW